MSETATREDLSNTVVCPSCHVGIGARCVTRSGKTAGNPHGRRYDAVEQAAGITSHRAARAAVDIRGIAVDRKAEDALLAAYAARLTKN